MRKKYLTIYALPILALALLSPIKALAFCPLCMVATGAFAGLFRWLGVDDTIVGLWLGAFTFSTALLLDGFLAKRKKQIPFRLFIVILLTYLSLFLSLFLSGSFNIYNNIFGINKIIFGVIFGSILIIIVPYLNKFIKKQNQGRSYISHQKVVLVIALLLVLSFGFYFLIK